MEILEADLPGTLGRSLARAPSGDVFTRGRALARLAGAVLPFDLGRGRALLDRGRELAPGGSFLEQDLALTELACVAAEGGDLVKAGELAFAHSDESRRVTGLLKLMEVGAADGVLSFADEAEALIRRLPAADRAASSAAELAVLLAPYDSGRSRALVDYAAELLSSVVDPEYAAWILAGLARASAGFGEPGRAFSFLDRAEALHVGYPEDRCTFLTELAKDAPSGREAFAARARGLLPSIRTPWPSLEILARAPGPRRGP